MAVDKVLTELRSMAFTGSQSKPVEV